MIILLLPLVLALEFESFLEKKPAELSMYNIEEALMYLTDIPEAIGTDGDLCGTPISSYRMPLNALSPFELCENDRYKQVAKSIDERLKVFRKNFDSCDEKEQFYWFQQHLFNRIEQSEIEKKELTDIKAALDTLAFSFLDTDYELNDLQFESWWMNLESYMDLITRSDNAMQGREDFKSIVDKYAMKHWHKPLSIMNAYMPKLCPAWKKLNAAAKKYTDFQLHQTKRMTDTWYDALREFPYSRYNN